MLKLEPKFLIVGEPTELCLPQSQKGMLKLVLSADGKAAHSGYPEMGKNAFDDLLPVIADFKAHNWPKDPLMGDTLLNIGRISGGIAANVLCPHAEADLIFRLVRPVEEIVQECRKLIGNRVRMEIVSSSNPTIYKMPAATKMSLPAPTVPAVSFNTDIPYFENREKCEAVVLFGAGSIKDAHSEWEFVKVDDLYKAMHIYYELAKGLLS